MVKVMWKEEVPKGTALIQQGDLQERHTTVKWPPELRFFLVFRGRLLLRRPVGQLSSFQDRERCQVPRSAPLREYNLECTTTVRKSRRPRVISSASALGTIEEGKGAK